jgi:hypothetical protein
MNNRHAILAAALCLCACSGPERAPHQPIQGVDTPETKVENPHDLPKEKKETEKKEPVSAGVPAAPELPAAQPANHEEPAQEARGHFLDRFVKQVAAAHKAAPGIVAVFPALSRIPDRDAFHVNGLGEHLMTETAVRLEAEGVRGVLAGAGLVNDIQASNRGLDSLRGIDDVYWLADRVGAAYAVFGTAEKRVFDRTKRDEHLEVWWECRRVADRSPVATIRERLTDGALATELTRWFRQESAFRIGDQAPKFQPSADAELRLASRQLTGMVAGKHGGWLKGKRVTVLPTSLRCLAGERAELQAWAAEFEQAFDDAEKKAEQAGNTDPAQAALQSGPVTIAGKEHKTFAVALEAFRARRVAMQASAGGELAADLGRMLAENLRAAARDSFELVAEDGERDALLAAIRREARAVAQAEGVDPLTAATLRARGTQVMVASTLRPYLKSYQLRVLLRDFGSGQSVSEAVDLDEQFKEPIDKILAR